MEQPATIRPPFAAVSRESVYRMAYVYCLAGIDRAAIAMLGEVLRAVGSRAPATVARLDVTEIGKLKPRVLVCDVDAAEVDALELLRRIRFVVPECLIVVYTGIMQRTWGVACHLAGVNCLLSKDSSEDDLVKGVRDALWSGCYTDPRFAVSSADARRAYRLRIV